MLFISDVNSKNNSIGNEYVQKGTRENNVRTRFGGEINMTVVVSFILYYNIMYMALQYCGIRNM